MTDREMGHCPGPAAPDLFDTEHEPVSVSNHAEAFYREVFASGELFGVEHEETGPVVWHLAGDVHARPFWSARSRAVRMLDGPLRRKGLVIQVMTWPEFVGSVVPSMEAEGLLVGVNWAGMRARGYNLEPRAVVEAVEQLRRRAAG